MITGTNPYNRRIILVADGSESARKTWNDVARTVAEIIRIAPADALDAIYLLGSKRSWASEEWRPNQQLPPDCATGSSFIGPVCAGLLERGTYPDLIVIVGAGEVFDLEDWVGIVEDWALVNTGSAALQPPKLLLKTFGLDSLELLREQMTRWTAVPPHHVPDAGLSGQVDQMWQLDETGYPMVYVPPIGHYMHLFPLTRVQLEAFLADCLPLDKGDTWYSDLLKLSPRGSPRTMDDQPYEFLFATGMLYTEVAKLVQWYGPHYALLTIEQWKVARDWLNGQPLSVLPASLEVKMAKPALYLWQGLIRTLPTQSLLDLSLMDQGVIEWVTDGEGNPGGMGDPRQSFYPGFHANPFMPTSKPRRSKFWGCRLVRS